MHHATEPTGRLTPVGPPEPPHQRQPLRWIVGVLLVLLLGLGAAFAAVLTSRSGDDPGAESGVVAEQLERPLERLGDAAQEVTPRRPASMVSLRVSAERAVEELDDADDRLRGLDADAQSDPAVRELEDAIDSTRELAEELASTRPSASEIAGLAEDARVSVADMTAGDLPEVDTALLVVALRRMQRLRAERDAADQEEASPAPAAPVPTPSPTPASPSPSYRLHSAFGYQAQIPTGPGWAEPADSQPNPRLFRTNVRGPDGMFVIIDYTPEDRPSFGGSYESSQEVGQTAFGSATEYVFQGGNLPECQRSQCVDYIIADPASPNSGFAVLAGGSDFALAQEIGRTVMESVVPQAYGE